MKESVDFLGSKSRESKKLGTWSRKLSQPTPKDQIWKKIAQEIEKTVNFLSFEEEIFHFSFGVNHKLIEISA